MKKRLAKKQKMFDDLNKVRKDIQEYKSTFKCGNDTVGIAENRTDSERQA